MPCTHVCRKLNPFAFQRLRLATGLEKLGHLPPGPKVSTPLHRTRYRILPCPALTCLPNTCTHIHPHDALFHCWYAKHVVDLLASRHAMRCAQVVLATSASLQAGYARQLLVDMAADPRNTILFTERAEVGERGSSGALYHPYARQGYGINIPKALSFVVLCGLTGCRARALLAGGHTSGRDSAVGAVRPSPGVGSGPGTACPLGGGGAGGVAGGASCCCSGPGGGGSCSHVGVWRALR